MRQHAIPQNILDIEFKLFTKFTVREFVYMAVGVGFGGIFLYFFTLGKIPGILAFPIFLLSSGLGLFLGLVNINEQKADIFLKNYIWAITHPTQRVWKNKMIDDRLGQEIKPEFNVTQGNMDRKNQTSTNSEIIGASADDMKPEYIESSKIVEFEKEEKERLDKITKLAKEAGDLINTSTSTPSLPTSTLQAPSQQMVDQVTQPPQQTEVKEQTQIHQPVQPSKIRIDINNKGNYVTTLDKLTPYVGNLNFKVKSNKGENLSQAILVIKDEQNRVLSALQSDNNGDAMSNRMFSQGTYNIEVQLNGYTFPQLQIIMDKQDFEPIKISAN